ncbi:methylmalonyl Co-A mutase-associated GTPase MeaB [Cyclobacteriaceae bacterium]|nr:methylmalonyl Co-A mutase-associated GTPase MeaB [Cyclobacteriaceae bacterium]
MSLTKRNLTLDQLKSGVLSGDRLVLSQAITLCESQLPEDQRSATQLIDSILSHTGTSLRIGVTGIPGVGKSTFIEAFGLFLIEKGHRIAVLSIDPTSSLNQGSILGDKTRMNELSQNRNAYIRPSPTSGHLGGISEKTRENMLLCEAAGFDVILIETVGVGQSEVAVKDLSDFLLLLMIAGAGDELQGIKRGLMELADMILVNKSDGENIEESLRTKIIFEQALHYFPQNINHWTVPIETISSRQPKNLDQVWKYIDQYISITKANDYFYANRKNQNLQWFREGLSNQLLKHVFQDSKLSSKKKEIEEAILQGNQSVKSGIDTLLKYAFN